jgi:hypothetical protein
VIEGGEEASFEVGGGEVIGAGAAEDGEEGGGVVAEVAAGIAVGDVVVEVGGSSAIDDTSQIVVDLGAGDGLGHGSPSFFKIWSLRVSRRRIKARLTRLRAAASSQPQASATSRKERSAS